MPTPTLAFGAPTSVPTGGAVGEDLLVTDVNADGLADVLVRNPTLGGVSLLRSQADGSLAAGVVLPAASNVAATAVADVNQAVAEMRAGARSMDHYGG